MIIYAHVFVLPYQGFSTILEGGFNFFVFVILSMCFCVASFKTHDKILERGDLKIKNVFAQVALLVGLMPKSMFKIELISMNKSNLID